MMRPYWVRSGSESSQAFLKFGIGITARSEADALAMFATAFGSDSDIRSIEIVENIDALDQGHVVPNMGNWLRRGIWFPLGFDHIQ
jgi:hypothetical protein